MSTPTPRMTSMLAFQEICDSGLLGTMQKDVLQVLYEKGPMTGSELDDYLTSPSAHKRVSELEQMGVVRSAGLKLCTVTKNEVLAWELTGNKPTPIKSKPGDTPTKRELSKAVEELRGMVRTIQKHDKTFKLSPELTKACQWLAKRAR